MKEKDVKLFNKAIHKVKNIIVEITKERISYKEKRLKLRDEHDGEMETHLEEAKEVLEELYELFEDLYNGKNGEKK